MKCIEFYRHRANMTQREVAEQIKVTQGSVSQWETGVSFPRPDKLPIIARLYRCSIEDLYGTVENLPMTGTQL